MSISESLARSSGIDSFIKVILSPARAASDCQCYLADVTDDGIEDGADIAPFIAVLQLTSVSCNTAGRPGAPGCSFGAGRMRL